MSVEASHLLAENGPFAIRKIKEGVLRTSGLPLDHALQIENEVSAAVMASKDAREGPRAFRRSASRASSGSSVRSGPRALARPSK